MRAMISLQQASLQRGTKILLDSATVVIHPGQRVGLIGANGSGKSSLFKLLIGQLAVDSGDCQVPNHWRIAHMAQEVHSVERSALDYVLDGDQALRKLEQAIVEANQSGDGEALAHHYDDLEALDGYTAQARAQQLLSGLGFNSSDGDRPVADFSGGWRIRLNLAQALMCPSDLLLLDEPTNHLDLDTTLWLEQWLQRYSGTLLIISHDRDFLDSVVKRIINVEQQKLIAYQGNYSAYEIQKAERIAQQAAAFDKQQQRVEEIESFVRRFRAKATKAKQAQSRLKELERMEKIAPAHVDSPFHFRFDSAEKMSNPLINLSHMDIGYGENPIIKKVHQSIDPSTRIGLLGPNGAGKSSLIKTLAGSLPAINGERVCGEHLRIGYFAQHQLEALDLDASSALHIQRISPKASEQQVRTFLGGFGFHGDRAFETIRHFSGGEKARLALSLIAWQKPNLLLLDEPTNHLDLEMRHALTVALQGFEGAVVVVSHDRHLLRNTVDEFMLVANGELTEFKGDLSDYYQWMLQQRSAENKQIPSNRSDAEAFSGAPAADKKTLRQSAAAKRERLKPLSNRLKKLEANISKLQKQLDVIEQELADTGLYDDSAENKAKLSALLQDQGKFTAQLEGDEEEWLNVSEELEELDATD